MQIILAPSKTMSMVRPIPVGSVTTVPRFLNEAAIVVDAVTHIQDVAHFMHVSAAIAQNVERMYESWGQEKAPSLFAYVGDVYKGFYAETLSMEDLAWAQAHVFIASGLYGILRPMDLISPYRLEMRAKLGIGTHKNLYEFWGKRVSMYVDQQPGEWLCILSSDEYAKVVVKYTSKRVVTPVFMDKKTNGVVRTVPIYSKMMRGILARWMIDHRIDTPEDIQVFSAQGYAFDKSRSTRGRPVFYRETPLPIRF